MSPVAKIDLALIDLVHEVNWAGELDDGEDLEFSDDSNGKEILWSKGTTVLVRTLNTRSSIGPVRVASFKIL
jgi:hypothetical protein